MKKSTLRKSALWFLGLLLSVQLLSGQEFEHGISLTAPPTPFEHNPMLALDEVCATWVAVIPYAFIPQGQTQVYYNMPNYQWWGETKKGVETTINLAKEAGKKVMLKPQVWSPHQWIGDLELDTPQKRSDFIESYKAYILDYARMADSLDVEMFCLGTELKQPLCDHPSLLEELIDSIRCEYQGILTYAANWDNYDQITFWDQLDVIGVNAYFPLSEERTPKKADIINQWKEYQARIDNFAKDLGRPIWFTEYGYLSVDYAASKTWELESKIEHLSINEKAQANALDAFYSTWKDSEWVMGGFLWKWFPEGKGHEGYPKKDYTPQNKQAMNVLIDHFCD